MYLSAVFADGDLFGAVADEDGQVWVFRNEDLLMKVDVSDWQNYDYFGWKVDSENTCPSAGLCGRLKSLSAVTNSSGALLMNLGYTYDVNGNITKIEDFVMGNPQTQTFTYDSIDRLASGQASGGTGGNYPQESYTYNSTTGNLVSKAGTNLTYNASVSCSAGNRPIPHAASAFGGSTYSYDCNGNMSGRTVSGAASTLTYNAENRLTGIAGANTASFIYDGDGNRVKSVVGGATMVTIGDYFEWTGSASTVKSYYYAGGARVAVRTGSSLNWILTDHLGSTSVVTDANGTLHSKQLYKPWGETRSTSGTLPTDYKYTGQRETVLGLYDYKARFYDPALGRFIQADSIVPGAGNPSAWDRYAYTLNNPVRYTDPSGHDVGLWDW